MHTNSNEAESKKKHKIFEVVIVCLDIIREKTLIEQFLNSASEFFQAYKETYLRKIFLIIT